MTWGVILGSLGGALGLGKLVFGEASRDANEDEEAELQAIEDTEDIIYAVRQCEIGSLIAVVDEDRGVLVQGRIHRKKRRGVVIDTRKTENGPDGKRLCHGEPNNQDLKPWVPQVGQFYVLLDSEEDEDEE